MIRRNFRLNSNIPWVIFPMKMAYRSMKRIPFTIWVGMNSFYGRLTYDKNAILHSNCLCQCRFTAVFGMGIVHNRFIHADVLFRIKTVRHATVNTDLFAHNQRWMFICYFFLSVMLSWQWSSEQLLRQRFNDDILFVETREMWMYYNKYDGIAVFFMVSIVGRLSFWTNVLISVAVSSKKCICDRAAASHTHDRKV